MNKRKTIKKRSIFRAIFVPLICLMILQSAIFYVAAVYGGIKDSLNQNAADIVKERLTNRKNELESTINNEWTDLEHYEEQFNALYDTYETEYGSRPFADNKELQIQFLGETSEQLIKMLRNNRTNGVFLILNNESENNAFSTEEAELHYGVGIRDMDATSAYIGTEDLLIERCPSALIETIGCSLDSWWESGYVFETEGDGDFFYEPIRAAYQNPGTKSEDIAYFSGAYRLSGSDTEVVSYSIPLMDSQGYPYGVLGIEITTKYMASLLPSREINEGDDSCYIIATRSEGESDYTPITASGAMFSRCFRSDAAIPTDDTAKTGGFHVQGRGNVKLHGEIVNLRIYNNNNPFDEKEMVLIAFVEENALFRYSNQVERVLLIVTLLTLALGVTGIFAVSRRFAKPITELVEKIRTMEAHSGYHLERLGIDEIDQLVDSIEELNENVSKEMARTDFFSRMSHDMRTPMNAIISFSSREMLEGADEKQRDEYLEKIHTSGEYLLGLINEVLDMTKIESNKVDLHYDVIPAAKLCDTVVPIVEKLAQKKQIKFIHTMDIPGEPYLKADTQHLNQIMLNLLSNAVKFTPDGGMVKLEVEAWTIPEDTQKLYCVIRVTDTGVGISRDFMDKLYIPFEQEREGEGGTGLGLSITRKLVNLMGGTIGCSSTKNEGTQFQVELSISKTRKPKMEAEHRNSEETDSLGEILRGKRVLLCEDHPLNTQIAVRLLERKGMIVDSAEDGQKGLQMFEASEEHAYDAILMDIRMPFMDGLEATERIRSLNRADAAQIPIIAMTANAFQEDIRKSRSAGMNEHLSKPIDPDKLYATLTELIALHTIKSAESVE